MHLDESDFREIIKDLWAFGMWTNKKYPADNILTKNGIEKIRRSLNDLLYGSEPLEKRFDDFNVKNLGMASITEIMSIVNPDEYALWNDKPRKVFQKIKVDQIPRKALKHTKIPGSDYVKCIDVMKEISDLLVDEGYKNMNLLDLDLFIWLVLDKSTKDPSPPPPPPPDPSSITHWDAIGMITEIGNALGYDTYVADPSKRYRGTPLRDIATKEDVPEQCKSISGIKRTDVIWFKYEPPIYMFEVEDKGTMRDALHRLHQAVFLNSRFFVVCPADNRSKFDRWVSDSPFKENRQRYQFRSFDDLKGMHDAVMNYYRVKSQFLSRPESGS